MTQKLLLQSAHGGLRDITDENMDTNTDTNLDINTDTNTDKKKKRPEMELYLHIPFCVQKCGYCDFLSFAGMPEDVHTLYAAQMIKEIDSVCTEYKDCPVTSIFIGGGTPSAINPVRIQQILEQVYKSFRVCPDAEITIECNPATLDAAKLRTYQSAGINRLSLGMQSADDRELRMLGRIHTYEQFVQNYELARKLGYENINIDIISSLPGQKTEDYERTLEKVIGLLPEHISAYSLMIEEGTPFYEKYGQSVRLREQGKEQKLLPSEEEDRQMYVLTKELLQSAGYDRYEISNYAREGYLCRHNCGYWMRKNYRGIGLGAASLAGNERFSNTRNLEEYLSFDFAAGGSGGRSSVRDSVRKNIQYLSTNDQMEEFMFLGLRMMRGVSSERFFRQFSRTLEDVYQKVLEKQLRQRLISKTPDGYCLTDAGIDVSNYVMAQYLFS